MDQSPSSIQIADEWTIQETRFDPTQVVTGGSNFMTGNGYLGYRGTFPEWDKGRYVGCVVSDTYDNADGKWKELCSVPNALFAAAYLNGRRMDLSGDHDGFVHGLSIKHGRCFGSYGWNSPEGGRLEMTFERFASYQSLHLIAQRVSLSSAAQTAVRLKVGIDSDIWSLHGDHFSSCVPFRQDCLLGVECVTAENRLPITVAGSYRITGAEPLSSEELREGGSIFQVVDIELPADRPIVLEQMMAVYSGNDTENPTERAVKLAGAALNRGYDGQVSRSDLIWDDMWSTYAIRIDSDDDAQALMNFNLYHNIIATPAHTDHLPIGARGLSCQAYQGAAFWDQEIFNLPMFLYTDPNVARNLLTYRYKTLEGARRKAGRLGYSGAFYAWISGDTGDELCPDHFFVDVLTGRRIRNHFNDWQIHISPDIAYAIWHYYLATGDWGFIKEYGAEMLFEIARFIVSYSCFKMDRQRYEILRLLGPDEYHENVDNNTFTNVQAVYALQAATWVYDALAGGEAEHLRELSQRIGLKEEMVELWKDMIERMYLPEADERTGVIEQFDGYFDLEDITPDRLESRLKDPGEYWGWPNGIAVETQVIKQADIVQLFCLHPDHYPHEVIRKNYDYYEPRTQHRSSLSPAVHSIVAARIDREAQAYSYFLTSCTIDLYNTNPPVSGGTFIGGIHTAACGIAWQMVVFGFAGFRAEANHVRFEPHMPRQWRSVEFSLIYRNQELRVRMDGDGMTVTSNAENSGEVDVRIGERAMILHPGQSMEGQS